MTIHDLYGISEVGKGHLEAHLMEVTGVASANPGWEIVLYASHWDYQSQTLGGEKMIHVDVVSALDKRCRDVVMMEGEKEKKYYMLGLLIQCLPLSHHDNPQYHHETLGSYKTHGEIKYTYTKNAGTEISIRKDPLKRVSWVEKELCEGVEKYPWVSSLTTGLVDICRGVEGKMAALGYDVFTRHLRACLRTVLEGGSCVVWMDTSTGLYSRVFAEKPIRKERDGILDPFSRCHMYRTIKFYGMQQFSVLPALLSCNLNLVRKEHLSGFGLRKGALYDEKGQKTDVVIFDSDVLFSCAEAEDNPFMDDPVLTMDWADFRTMKGLIKGSSELGEVGERGLCCLTANNLAMLAPISWICQARMIGFVNEIELDSEEEDSEGDDPKDNDNQEGGPKMEFEDEYGLFD